MQAIVQKRLKGVETDDLRSVGVKPKHIAIVPGSYIYKRREISAETKHQLSVLKAQTEQRAPGVHDSIERFHGVKSVGGALV